MWTSGEFIKYILLPVVVAESALWLIWLALPQPAGHPVYSFLRANMVAAAIALPLLGVFARRNYQRPRRDLSEVLGSVPRPVWCAFIGAHGAIIGMLLSVALEAPFMPMLLGFGGAMALAGAFVRVRKPGT